MSGKEFVRLLGWQESLRIFQPPTSTYVKKKDGGEYEPASLSSFQRSIQRHLKDKNSLVNLFQDTEFAKSREVLLAKKRELVEKHAKGKSPTSSKINHRK